jgi:dienelactone hydrolase
VWGRSRRGAGRVLLRAVVALSALAGIAGCTAGGASLPPAPASSVVSHVAPVKGPSRWPPSYPVAERTIVVTDPTRPTLDYSTSPPSVLSSSRSLAVEIRYPAGGSARGPYPVIVFAHGYAVMPDTYRSLLDAWASAGFVVVAPVFPVSNYYQWELEGVGAGPEDDTRYEPGDVAFVVRSVWQLSRDRGSFLHGLVDLRRLALAGQSDGASVVAGLEYAAPFRPAFASLPVRPLAVAVLSGAEFDGSPLYSQPTGRAPALLAVESDADGCNPPGRAAALYDAVAAGAAGHWFLTLHGAPHAPPYFGAEPWFGVVRAVTTAFFGLELGEPVSAGSLARLAAVAGVASWSSSPQVTVPPAPPAGGCGTPAPFPPA